MQLALFGASGRTGTRIVEQALLQGHTVRALTRRPMLERVGVTWIEGDILDPSVVAQVTTGCRAAIVAIGPRSNSPGDICSRGTATVVAACRAFRTERLVVVTGAMIGHPTDKLSLLYRTLRATFRTTRRSEALDRDRQEAIVEDSGIPFTLVRPPKLVDGEPTSDRMVGSELRIEPFSQATTGDVAQTAIDAAVLGTWLGIGVTVLSG
jgi:putative NADH-flavin reductase